MLSHKCEKFLNKLHAEENNDELESNDELDMGSQKEDGDDDYGLLSGQERKKRAVNKTRTDKSFYLKFILAILAVEAYYAYSYY